MTTNFSGKTVVITGASKGIGAAVVNHFHQAGANVALLARSASALQEQTAALGERALPVACDVSDANQVEQAMREVLAAFGRIDVLVNNAGIIDPVARVETSDPAAWSRAIDVNTKGVYYASRAAFPALRDCAGLIVNLSSGAATSALEGWSHYCASKAAVLALTRCLHKEWAPLGIRVVGLSPGTVATDMQRVIKASGVNPVSQLDWSAHLSADDVAKAIAWLTTSEAQPFDGDDFSLKTEEGRRLAGLR